MRPPPQKPKPPNHTKSAGVGRIRSDSDNPPSDIPATQHQKHKKTALPRRDERFVVVSPVLFASVMADCLTANPPYAGCGSSRIQSMRLSQKPDYAKLIGPTRVTRAFM
ncbi:MAG: hypothetical protein IT525_08885 [Nitrosomonas sp.]|nr:hypothetical protein [Nitrosomonas sp.]